MIHNLQLIEAGMGYSNTPTALKNQPTIAGKNLSEVNYRKGLTGEPT
jgi:hypothetical protein